MKTRLMLSVAVFAFIACLFHSTAAQPAQERVIRRLPIEKNEPIEIIDIRVNGQSVSLDKKFTADDEWLSSLVFAVKNRSDKRILFASIRLQFPRPIGAPGNPAIYDMSYGNWALQTRIPNSDERSVGLQPGETATIRLTARRFADLKDFLSMAHYPYSIDLVELSIAPAIFDDDTMWYAGAISRRDPKDPTTWINSQYLNSKPK